MFYCKPGKIHHFAKNILNCIEYNFSLSNSCNFMIYHRSQCMNHFKFYILMHIYCKLLKIHLMINYNLHKIVLLGLINCNFSIIHINLERNQMNIFCIFLDYSRNLGNFSNQHIISMFLKMKNID